MTGVIFVETLRRSWRGMFGWGLSIGSLAFVVCIIVPSVDALEQMAELMGTLPPILTTALGGGDLAYMATPEGYLALQYFSFILLVFAAYGIVGGLSVTINDEEHGTMDVFLSLPVPRWRLILEKFLAYAILLLGAILISYLCMWLGIVMTPALTVDMSKIVAATVSLVPSALAVLAFTLMIATVVRRRSHAMAIAAFFLVGSYFLDTLAKAAPSTVMNTLGYLSFYRYYDGSGVMQHGLSLGNLAVPLVATALLVLVGMWAFQRRDVGL